MPSHEINRGAWDPLYVVYRNVRVGPQLITRPVRLEGTVGGGDPGPLPYDVYPIALYPDANGSQDPSSRPYDLPPGFQRGHIMGKAIGGPPDFYNLIPMPSTVNTGMWKLFENAISDYWKTNKTAGIRIYFRAVMNYPDDVNNGDSTIPNSLQGWAYHLPTPVGGYNRPARTAALDAFVAAGLASQVAVFGPHNLQASLDNLQAFTGGQNDALDAIEVAYTGWMNSPTPGGGHAGDPPVGFDLGPYHMLVVVDTSPGLIANLNAAFPTLNYPGTGVTKTTFGRAFQPAQKSLIRIYNVWNNARYRSDNSFYDQYRRLGLIEAQIDHIIPQAGTPGGPNYYWNAQLTSHEYNSKKGKKTEDQMYQNWLSTGVAGRLSRRKRFQTKRYTPY